MSHWMFNCKDITKKVSESMDRTLPLHERMMITIHLWMCKYCNRFKRHLQILRNAVRQEELSGSEADQTVSLPMETRVRIEQTLRSALSDPTK